MGRVFIRIQRLALVFNQEHWQLEYAKVATTMVVTNMNGMFYEATAFNQPVDSEYPLIGILQVTNYGNYVFPWAKAFNQNIGSWNTVAVTNMMYMLRNASSFNQNIGNWQLNPVVNMANMLDNSGMDCQNYSFTLQGWANNANTPSGRDRPQADKVVDLIKPLLQPNMQNHGEYRLYNCNGSSGSGSQATCLDPNIVAEAKSKVYGSVDPALTYTVTGLANGDDQSIITGALTRVAGEAVGLMKFNKCWKLLGTYEFNKELWQLRQTTDITYTQQDFTITKAILKHVARQNPKRTMDDQSIITVPLTRVAGGSVGTYEIQQDPTLTYTVTGLTNGDDQSIITGTLTRVAGEAVGTYEIQQGTLSTTANYDIVYTAADFNITKATLNIVAEAKSKVYGSADPALTYTVTGLANGDDQSIITGALTRVAGEAVGTYEIQQGTLATTANYDITYTAADFNITKATLNIVAEAKSKVYGSADPALTYTVTGLANNDDQSIITGALTRVAGEAVGTYEIQQGTLATTANYELVYTTADFTITKATLNIVAEAKSKVYGSVDPALTYTVTGLANGDDQSIITGALTRVAGEAVGTYEIQQGTLTTTANYDITYTAADFNITKATLNIVAEEQEQNSMATADPV
ncbi:hypothetical protein FQR65_LT17210 [Abscondita terminalis]|nr:hypothetical protein FQR65_LT17210 [Abscondita terminalis]